MIDEDDVLRTAAAEIFEMRRRRRTLLPIDAIGEAAWDMLLFAFQAEKKPLQSKELVLSTHIPESTAKRMLEVLESSGLLRRVDHPTRMDRRAVFYELTDEGRLKVRKTLEFMLRD